MSEQIIDHCPLQAQLNILMEIFEDNKDKLSDGVYLKGMNALGSVHKQNLKKINTNESISNWMTYDDICEEDDIYDEVMQLADDIVVELCGDESSIYSDNNTYNLVPRGDENIIFDLLINYRPVQGNAGFNSHPMILHHAIQFIIRRLFKDTTHELDIVRPVSCKCGWRGTQGNWDRHIDNSRHQRWVNEEKKRKTLLSNN